MNLNSSRQKTVGAQTLSPRTRNTPENMQNENSLNAMIKDRFLATYTSEDFTSFELSLKTPLNHTSYP